MRRRTQSNEAFIEKAKSDILNAGIDIDMLPEQIEKKVNHLLAERTINQTMASEAVFSAQSHSSEEIFGIRQNIPFSPSLSPRAINFGTINGVVINVEKQPQLIDSAIDFHPTQTVEAYNINNAMTGAELNKF